MNLMYTIFLLFTTHILHSSACSPCQGAYCYAVPTAFSGCLNGSPVKQYATLFVSIPAGKITIGPTIGLIPTDTNCTTWYNANNQQFPIRPIITTRGPITFLLQLDSSLVQVPGQIVWNKDNGVIYIISSIAIHSGTPFGWQCADLYYSAPTLPPTLSPLPPTEPTLSPAPTAPTSAPIPFPTVVPTIPPADSPTFVPASIPTIAPPTVTPASAPTDTPEPTYMPPLPPFAPVPAPFSQECLITIAIMFVIIAILIAVIAIGSFCVFRNKPGDHTAYEHDRL